MRLRLLAGSLLAAALASCAAPAAQLAEPAPTQLPLELPSTSTSPLRAASRRPSAPTTTIPSAGRPAGAALRRRLAGLLADRRLAVRGPVAVSVIDGRGRPVFEHRADLPLLPASTLKLATAAAALPSLGPNFRYRTPVWASVSVGADGVLRGSLVLVGSGDPALGTPLFGRQVWPDRPRTPLERLADQLVRAGLKRVTGDLVGDPSAFTNQPVAAGWIPRYLGQLDATRVSGLTVNAGRRLSYRGGRLIGEPAQDPSAEAAARLKGLLEERRIRVDGTARSSPTPPVAAVQLAAVDSAPLRDLLRHTVQDSDNHMADAIFRTVGRTVLGSGSWEGAGAAAQRVLAGADLDWNGVVLADGSGLSRENRLTAGFLTRLDLSMNQSSVRSAWRELMAVAGRSGTLRHRLRGTLAAGAFRGKTGSLDDVRSLVGWVDGPRGRYHLAVIGNRLRGAEKARLRQLQDQLILMLTEDLHGCVRPAASAPPPGTRHPARPAASAPPPGTRRSAPSIRLGCRP